MRVRSLSFLLLLAAWTAAGCGGKGSDNQNNNEPMCGNGVVDPGEQCDATDLDGQTCYSVGYHGGTLACFSHNCMFDTSDCTMALCGNGQIDPE